MKKIIAISMVLMVVMFVGCKNSAEADRLSQEAPQIQSNTDNSVNTSSKRAAYPYSLNPQVFKKSSHVFSIVAWAHFPSATQNVTQTIDVYEVLSPSGNSVRLGYNSKFIFNVPAGNHWYASLNRLTVSAPTNQINVVSKITYPNFPYQHIKLYSFYLKDL